MIGTYAASDFHVSCSDAPFYDLLTRLIFVAPDGTQYQLHDQLYQGAPYLNWSCGSTGTTRNRGKVFTTADGGSVTFISDADIYDNKDANLSLEFSPSGYLLMRDGTRYRIDSGKVSWIRDRNGNKVSFTFEPGSWLVSTITDSLNRLITISYANQSVSYDTITFKGFVGADRSIKVWRSPMQQALRQGSTIQLANQLFPEVYIGQVYWTGGWEHNPTVVSKVELPDNRAYQFYYNSFGELARVILPTGGGFDYDYPGAGNSTIGLIMYRRLLKRSVYNTLTPTTDPNNPPAGTLENKEVYSTGDGGAAPASISVTVEHRDGNNFLLAQEKHYYYGSPTDEANGCSPILYSPWYSGREFKTESYNVNGGVLGAALRRVDHTWYPSLPSIHNVCNGTENASPAPNPKITDTVTSLLDTNQVAKQTFGYDQYNNQTDVWEYDYATGAPGALLRHTHTDYLTSGYDTIVGGATNPDPAATIHIRNFPTSQAVYSDVGTSNKMAETTYEYDDYLSTGQKMSRNPLYDIKHSEQMATNRGRGA